MGIRDIEFRAKAVNRDRGYHRTDYKNGEWVYGLITKLYDKQFPTLPAEMRNEYGVTGIEIDYKTIGQYTGLTDKNGKKIFEGDIVRWCGIKGIVVWEGHKFYVKSNLLWDFSDDDCIKVIGNVHDNPELLRSDGNDR